MPIKGDKMRKLCDELPISIWENIANFINKLNIKDYTEQEFLHNLKLLKKFLSINKIFSIEGKRQASSLDEVGIATLLQEIYNCKSTKLQKKENITDPRTLFHEKINTLKNIGVKEIQFGFTGNISKLCDMRISDVYTFYKDREVEMIKYYTNGTFKVEPDHLYNSYCITDLKNADYYLEAFIYWHKWKIYIAKLCVHLKNFNGEYPNKEEILSIKLPTLNQNNKITNCHTTKEEVKQYFKAY